MVSHKAVAGSLDAYADGTLPEDERGKIAAHLRTCAECGASLREIHQLHDILNDLPEIPVVPFARFWSKLEPRLPGRVQKRAPLFRPARLAAGFALAILASLVGVVALASDSVMPDNPLYSVKHFRQDVQLSLADARERPRLELFLGKQRLNEAAMMVKRKRPDLAVAALRDVRTLLVDAAPQLRNTAGEQSDAAEVKSALSEIQTGLTAVRGASTDSGTDVTDTAVQNAVEDAENAVTQVERRSATPGRPEPTEAAGEPSP
jgi:hypothetical protein